MKRREFIALLGGAVVGAPAWPRVAHTQGPAIPTIGYLTLASSPNTEQAFRQGLNEAGYIEGRNVRIEFHSANNQAARLPELAANLVRSQVAVIVAAGGPAIFAAKAATSTIPMVFATNLDPVKTGLVASLNRPGGNMTGVATMSLQIWSKQLDLLRQMVPRATTFVYLSDPRVPTASGYLFDAPVPKTEEQTSDIVSASRALGAELVVVEARGTRDIERAFSALAQRGTGALVVGAFALFDANRERILGLAAGTKIPAMYYDPSWVMRGGLMSYSPTLAGLRNVIVDYVGRILKGAKPADLPVQQPIKFELFINRGTAEALGLTIPETLLATADEVIE